MAASPHELTEVESLRFTKNRMCVPRFGAWVYTTGVGGAMLLTFHYVNGVFVKLYAYIYA